MNRRRVFVVTGFALIVGTGAGFGLKSVLADGIPSPSPLYYSGTLSESGAPVTGTRALTIYLWPDGTSTTTPLCQTTATTVPVLNGRFRIALASSCKQAINENPNAYVEVVEGTISLGRSPMGAVPYAVEADHAVSATTAQAAAGVLAQQVVPAGAVMAFNLSACPAGWSAFSAAGGRTVIGVNAPGGNGLSQRKLADTPGEETHTMTSAELATHTHRIVIYGQGSGPNQGTWNYAWAAVGAQSAPTPLLGAGVQNFMANEPAGASAPFNNLQPSIALLYCTKT